MHAKVDSSCHFISRPLGIQLDQVISTFLFSREVTKILSKLVAVIVFFVSVFYRLFLNLSW